MDDAQSISSQAHCLIAQIASKCHSRSSIGFYVVLDLRYGLAVYARELSAFCHLAQSPSFEFILRHELETGYLVILRRFGNGILNTAASLRVLALKRHPKSCTNTDCLDMRASKAVAALDGML